MKSLLSFLVVGIILSGAFYSLFGQTVGGTISGTVQDSTNAVVPGAKITVTNVSKGLQRTVTSDSDGRYRVTQLEPGEYQIEAVQPGFSKAIRRGIQLTVGREAVVDVTLEVGTVAQTVEVTGEAPLIQTTTSEISGLVDQVRIRELPLNGRSWEALAFLEPGVIAVRNTFQISNVGMTAKFSSAGSKITSNSFFLDGADINDVASATPGSVAGQLLGVEAIREFKVLTHNYGPEFGRTSGAIVTAVTRSGSNELHGSVFEFLRNSALDARNFFDTEIPSFKRNQFGGTLGGPIKRDRTFFFGAYEGLRERLGLTRRAFVPDARARQGFLPDQQGGESFVGLPEAVQPYLALFPLPNGRTFGDGTGEFAFPFTQKTRDDYALERVDYELTNVDSIFVRYTFDDGFFLQPQPMPQWNFGLESRTQYAHLEWHRVFSPTVVNSARFAFARFASNQGRPDNDISKQDPSIPQNLSFIPGLPFGYLTIGTPSSYGSIGSGSVSALGSFVTTPGHFSKNTWQWSDDLLYSKGRHSVGIGVNIERMQYNYGQRLFGRGFYSFAGLRAFLLNQPSIYWTNAQNSYFDKSPRQTMAGMYFRDNFQVVPRLTLNLGIRYEIVSIPKDTHNNAANLKNWTDPALSPGIIFDNPSLKNFQPRLGLAWNITGNGKTVFRAGAGIYSDAFIDRSYIRFMQEARVIAIIIPAPFPNGEQVARSIQNPPRTINVLMVTGTPQVAQYSMGFEHELRGGTLLSAGYVGSAGWDLERPGGNWNLRVPSYTTDGRKFWTTNNPLINPNFNPGGESHITDAHSWYNSLQLRGVHRFKAGMQIQGVYTWSKSIDQGSKNDSADGNGEPDGMDPFDHRIDQGLSSFDVRHSFSLNSTYELPASNVAGFLGKVVNGWQFNSIVTIHAGTPFTVTTGFGRALRHPFFSNTSERPDLAPGASNNPVLGGPDRYYNSSAFVLQAPGTFGNVARNTVIGPGLATVDIGLTKNTRWGESKNIQFRFEGFNLLNRTNFALPASQIFNADGTRSGIAGRIISTVTTSRQLQFALKFIF